MRKHLFLAALAAVIGILFFFGCKKSDTAKSGSPLNPNTVTKDLARQVAQKFTREGAIACRVYPARGSLLQGV